MEINYTIIIPHKNIPHLLQRCLDSIPRRNDLQIIVVDDNSDEDIVDFCGFR
jgi:glycosyltransferase involved in cell wall biosynthesis